MLVPYSLFLLLYYYYYSLVSILYLFTTLLNLYLFLLCAYMPRFKGPFFFMPRFKGPFFSDFEFQFILNIVYIVYLPLYPNMLLHINGVEKGFRLSSNGRNARSRP